MNIPLEVVRSAVNQTLEQMYFCEGDWVGCGTLNSLAIGARVTFSGSARGEFRLIATPRLAMQLTADFLAEDTADVTDSQAQALMNEFANVACGATLISWMPDADFHFSVPSGLTREEARLNSWPQRFCVFESYPELAVDVVLCDEPG